MGDGTERKKVDRMLRVGCIYPTIFVIGTYVLFFVVFFVSGLFPDLKFLRCAFVPCDPAPGR